ncbi:hypothetical protein ACNTMW_14150 [Planosporangium sp. 12N6]|uniref:hypothetical protein n=1 Tax=Planosporangium spinosum TaxID=3402278 RepID=UPI003CEE0925
MKTMPATTPPPATAADFLALLEDGGGVVQVADPPEQIRAAWRRAIHALKQHNEVPDGWHLLHRGRNSGDLVIQLKPGQHPWRANRPGVGSRILVPELLADPHPVVDALRNQPARLPASPQNRSRTLMLLEALAREAERRGLVVRAGQDAALLQVVADEEPYSVRVHEETGARWTLRVVVGLVGAGTGGRDRWADRAKQPVEEQLGDILDEIVRQARAVSRERRRQRRREERRRAEEQERLLTDYRAEILREQVRAWSLAEDIRGHCDQLVAAGMDPDDKWLRWARRYADEVDPVIDPPGLPAPVDPAELHRQRRPAPPPQRPVAIPVRTPWHPNRRWWHQ